MLELQRTATEDRPLVGTRPAVAAFFDKRTCSVQYVVADPETKQCAIIDPVLDFEPKSGATATHSADALLCYVRSEGYVLQCLIPILTPITSLPQVTSKAIRGRGSQLGKRSLTSRSFGGVFTTYQISRPTARNGTSSLPMASGSISAT